MENQPITKDCDVSAIDRPFLLGIKAFAEWVLDIRKTMAPPENPYDEVEEAFEHHAWETGWFDAEAIWFSWQ